MGDDLLDLKRKLEEIERKTAIWRSQVMVLLLVFVAGWIASALWMTARIEARVGKTEARVAGAEARAAKAATATPVAPKVIEAQAFVLKTEAGLEIASLRKVGDDAVLALEGVRKSVRTDVSHNGFAILDTRPERVTPGDDWNFVNASVAVHNDGRLVIFSDTGIQADVLAKSKKLAP